MKSDRSDHLIDRLLGSDEMEKLRRATLESGLAGLRRRRAHRRALRVCAVACLFIVPVFVSLFYLYQAPRVAGVSRPGSTAALIEPDKNKGTKIITDEELFALFPGRPLALVGTPGHQQLVFLDQLDGPKSYLTESAN